VLSLLVIDGFSSESPESELVTSLARHSSKFSSDILLVTKPTDQMLKRRWSVVWFCGHVTVHRKVGTATLEQRRGRGYQPLCAASLVAQARCSLLVMSGCYTSRPEVSGHVPYAHNLVTYDGKLYLHDSLVFASSFMWLLRENVSARRVTAPVVRYAFGVASKAAGDGYRLRSR